MKGGNTMFTWMVLDQSDNEVASGKERSMGAAQEAAASAATGRTASTRTAADLGSMSDQELLDHYDSFPEHVDTDQSDEFIKVEDEVERRGLIDAMIEAARHPREDGKLSTEPGTLGFDERHIPYRRDKARIDVTAGVHTADLTYHVDREGPHGTEVIVTEDGEQYGFIVNTLWGAEATDEDIQKTLDEHGFGDAHKIGSVTAFIDEPAGGFGGTGQRDYIGTSAEELAGKTYEDIDGPDFNPAMQNADDVVVAERVLQASFEVLDGLAAENGWQAEFFKDPMFGDLQRTVYRYGDQFVISVNFKKVPSSGFDSASLSTQDTLGNARDEIAKTSNENVVHDWLQLFFLDHESSVIAHVPDNEDGTLVDVMDPEDTVEAAFDEDGLTEDEVVARFQRSAGHIMSEGGAGGGDHDIASAALAHLRTAGRTFTMAEQQALIDEEPVGGPVDRSGLDLSGTHYLS